MSDARASTDRLMTARSAMDDANESRWLGIVCNVFGFRSSMDLFGEKQITIPGDAQSWLVSSDEHLWVVLSDRFTVAVFWADDEKSAFWFGNDRTYEMSEKDMRCLDALDRLSCGDFYRLAADWMAYLEVETRSEVGAT